MKTLTPFDQPTSAPMTAGEMAAITGGYHVQGNLMGWSWNGDATQQIVGTVTRHSEAKLGFFSGGDSATMNCYQYDFNGYLNGSYVNSGWSNAQCIPFT